MQKWLTVISLTLSAAALALSVWTYRHADDLAEQALRRRERHFVEQCKPSIVRIAKDFDIEAPTNAETLDELCEPLLKLMNAIGK